MDDRPFRRGLGSIPATHDPNLPLLPGSQPTEYDTTTTYDVPPPAHVLFKEWAINPTRHGPERLTKPPIFVLSEGRYDEMGRSTDDGVGVEFKQTPTRREGQSGEQVAGWYIDLASRPSTPGAGPSRPHRHSPPSRAPLPADVDSKPLIPHLDSASTVRVKRNEWFIRRALLASAKSSDSHPRPEVPHRPSSISTMLNIQPTKPKLKPANYVLGPGNKGYELLRGTFRWEGGGLGRRVGWTDEDTPPVTPRVTARTRRSESAEVKLELDRNGHPIVDLSKSDTDSEIASDTPNTPEEGGPGRTAPIATSLKLDKLGIGHRRSRPKGQEGVVKKVTHTVEEIEKAQRRARYTSRGSGAAVELGKKGKIKWKDKEKRERDERKRILATLNS